MVFTLQPHFCNTFSLEAKIFLYGDIKEGFSHKKNNMHNPDNSVSLKMAAQHAGERGTAASFRENR